MIDPSVIRRLAFIRYLFGLGVGQSRAPEPLASASLLTFHDSVELFLLVASEHLNVGAAQLSFMDYWAQLSQKLPNGCELPQKEAMRRLNKSRVALKHHGTLPSKLDVDAFRAATGAFFLDSTPLVFGKSFDEISRTEFVTPDPARDKLKAAEQELDSDDLKSALCNIAIAFAEIINDYEDRKRGQYGDSPFFFGHDLTFQNSFFMGLDRAGLPQRLGEFADRVKESIDMMQDAIRMLALGLDYRRYSRFQLHAPYVTRMPSGSYHVQRDSRGSIAKKEDVRFCIDFVIETAVHLREFDYDVPAKEYFGSE